MSLVYAQPIIGLFCPIIYQTENRNRYASLDWNTYLHLYFVRMMFSNDGFLTSTTSTNSSGQTHLFTTFPDSAVDPEDDVAIENPTNSERSYGYNPSNSEQSSLPLPATANSTKNEQLHIWQIEYYQQYFQIDTQQILERLVSSVTPRPNKSYFNSNIRHNPDLYGPFWVCVTFIVTVAISGNIITYFHTPNADFQIDFSKITLSAIVCVFFFVVDFIGIRIRILYF